jgi:serine phosphatase RsbU (regulator of sigma subunit)
MSYQLFLATASLTVGGLIILLGAVILRESPRQRLNRITAAMLFFASLGAVLGGLGFLLSSMRPAGAVLDVNLVRTFAYLWEFFFPALLLFAAVFPTQAVTLKRHPHLWPAFFAPHAFHVIIILGESALGPDFGLKGVAHGQGFLSLLAGLLGIVLSLIYRTHRSLFSFVNLAYVFASMWLFARSYRRSASPMIHRQLQVIFGGLGGCVALYSAAYPLPTILGLQLPEALATTLLVSALVLGCGSVAFAIVRYRFLDTKIIARRSILTALATALIVGLYLLVVRQVDRILAEATGLDVSIFDTAFLVIALIVYQPIIAKTEEILERLLLRERTDYRNLLLRLSEDVTSVLDLPELGAGIARTLTESMAVNGAALVLTDGGGMRIEASHEMADREELERGLLALHGFPRGAGILRADQLAAGGEDDPREPAEALQRAGVHIVLPLRHHGECLGFLLLGQKAAGTRFTTDDMSLLRTLGNQVAVGIRNASLYKTALEKSLLEEDLAIARRIQESYLPETFPRWPCCDIHAANIPSRQVGGDYYDVIPAGSDRFFIAIADVSGKGVPASLLTAMLHASLHAYVVEGYGVAEVLTRVNRRVEESTSADQFITTFLALVDTTGRELRYSNAGHNPPLLLRSDGSCEWLTRGGLILGVHSEAEFEEVAVALHPGDRIVLYTDGITEARDAAGEEFGEERLVSLVRGLRPSVSAAEIVGAIQDAVARHEPAPESSDDRTVLVVKVL